MLTEMIQEACLVKEWQPVCACDTVHRSYLLHNLVLSFDNTD